MSRAFLQQDFRRAVDERTPRDLAVQVMMDRDELCGAPWGGATGGYGVTAVFENSVFKAARYAWQEYIITQECGVVRHAGENREIAMSRFLSEFYAPYSVGAYFEMTRAVGWSMARSLRDGLPDEAQADIARGVAGFVHHFAAAFTPGQAEKMLAVRYGGQDGPGALTPAAVEFLGDYMTASVRSLLEESADAPPGEGEMVIHADLSPDNIFMKKREKTFTEVIDFGCLDLVHRAAQAFRPLYRSCGKLYPRMMGTLCSEFSRISGRRVGARDLALAEVDCLVTDVRHELAEDRPDKAAVSRDKLAEELFLLDTLPRRRVSAAVPGRIGA